MEKILHMMGIKVSSQETRQVASQDVDVSTSSPRRKNSQGITKALIIASVFMIFQQITGINIPLYYGPKILKSFFAGAAHSLVTSSINGVSATAILAFVMVLAQYLAFQHIDNFGRKKLATLGYGGMAVFMLMAGLGLIGLHGLGSRRHRLDYPR